jgi:hypothetical protein
MTAIQSRSIAIVVAAWLLVPVPIAWAVLILGLRHRPFDLRPGLIDSDIHIGANGIVAIALLASALINATAVSMTTARLGGLPYPYRYLAWQLIALCSAGVWLGCTLTGLSVLALEVLAIAAVTLASIMACVYAMRE